MLTHEDIWRALDRFAQANGMSPSGLARRSGLDPTTFNKSKRITREGKPRWPSTESLSKVLGATGSTLSQFVTFLSAEREGKRDERVIPLIGLAQAAEPGAFDERGRPAGSAWDETPFPGVDDGAAYALEILGDALSPVYRDGDVVVVVPESSLRRGDRVVVRTEAGEIVIMRLARRSANRVELQSFNGDGSDRSLGVGEIVWMARIVWASQ